MPEPAMLDYFYGDEAEQYTFYRIPKVLFTDPAYRRISSDAKILYGLMLDRMGLSVRNDIMRQQLGYNADLLDDILDIMVDTVCSSKRMIRIGGEDYPREVVKNRLLKINGEHIGYVIDCLKENTTKVRNIRAYLLTSLYNAPTTINSYYTALVNHDLYGGG